MKRNDINNQRKGFTLVEIIVVLVILAILAAMVIPSLIGYIDKAAATKEVSNARYLSLAASAANIEWYAQGQPGNGDSAYKVNIEQLIIDYIGSDFSSEKMVSHEKNKSATKNVVQVGFSPVGGQWDRFLADCKANNYQNYLLVFMHKNAANKYKVDGVIDGLYYMSADGQFAVRIIYSEGTKLGSVGTDWIKQ